MLKTLSYTSGRPEIVNADFEPADLVEAKVPLLMNRHMQLFLYAHAMRAVCDHRGQVVARFQPSYIGEDFPKDAA